jgi:carboxymethylenebutenolidase
MNRVEAFALLALLAAARAPAAEQAVSFKSGAEQASGVLVTPEGKGPFPAVLVVQEWCYGAEDKGPAPEQVRAFEDSMKKAGKAVDVKIYPGAGHAFANVDNPWGGYRKEATEDAWARTKAFLAKHLEARRPSS